MVLKDYFNKYFDFLKKIFSSIKLNTLNRYLEIAENPLKNNKLFQGTIKIIIITFLLNFIFEKIPLLIKTFLILLTLLPYFLIIREIGISIYYAIAIIGLVLWVFALLLEVLIMLIFGIYASLEYFVAKTMDGKGGFNEHINISYGSYLVIYIISLPVIILLSIFMVIESLPLLDMLICLLFFPLFILQVIRAVFWIYGLYIKFILLKKIHGFNNYETLITMIAPLYILAFFLFLFSFLILILLYIGIQFI